MKAFSITLKDLQVFIRDRGAVFMLFLLPFALIAMISLVTQGVSVEEEAIKKYPLVIVNNDPDGKSSQEFLETLNDTGRLELNYEEDSVVQEQLIQAQLRYALIIPSDFSAGLASGNQVTLRLLLHPAYDETQVMAIERLITRTVREYLMVEYLYKGLDQMRQMQAASPNVETGFSEERILAQIESQKRLAQGRPLIQVVESKPSNLIEEESVDTVAIGQFSVVGMAVLFVFLGAQNTAMSLFKEKKLGSFRRLMAAPISKTTLLSGKMLPSFLLSLIQLVVIFITGGYLIQLFGIEPLSLDVDIAGLILVSLAVAVCSACLGIFIAAIVKTENQVGGLSSVLLFMAGLLGGSFIPLFMFSKGLENIARFIPHYWANQAYYGLFFRGLELADLWLYIGMLLVFALAFFGFGLWRFKFE